MTYKFVEFPKYVHHPKHTAPPVLVHDEDAEAEVLKQWDVSKEDNEIAVDNSRDTLLKRADAIKLKVDQRWSDQRLKRAVEEAEAE